MCFSAGASFGAAAILGGAGIMALKKTTRNPQLMFAGIPVLFALQQAGEGLLWLSLSHELHKPWQIQLVYIFLFFAQILWTSWMPLSFMLIEPEGPRKKILAFVSAIGLANSCLLGWRLVVYNVYAQIQNHHVYYGIQSPQAVIALSSILYVIATVFPPFISSARGMRTLGALLAASLLLTKIFYSAYLISVWCFFAALISITIVFILNTFQKEAIKNKLPAQSHS